MQIRQLEYFVAVAENLNFTKTAKLFYISQTAVTQQIKALEQEIGVDLFYRDNRNVSLTPAGKTFYEDVVAILNRTKDAVGRTQMISTGFTGDIKIGLVKGYEKTNISELLSRFHTKYSNISLSLIRNNVGELYENLIKNKVDIAFNLKFSMEGLKDIAFITMKEYPLKTIMPVAHPLSHRISLSRADLKGHTFIAVKKEDSDFGVSDRIRNDFLKAGFFPEKRYASDDIETSILMVSAGFGYTILPSFITDSISTKEKVAVIPLNGEENHVKLIAAWNNNNSNPALIKFINELKQFRDNYAFEMTDLEY